jgi:23S rRNA pseudouridine1911/1915/1917 synthase
MSAPGTRVVVAGPEDEGARLDAFLSRSTQLSRTQVQRLIESGRVRVVGASAPRKSEPVVSGQRFEVEVPPAEPVEMEAEDLPLSVVYEDDALLVVDKAAGMVVHPAPGHRRGTLVNALLHHVKDLAGVGGRLRPGIVHRLDRDTSGLLVVAKRDDAHQGLVRALKARQVRRLYRAASWGHLSASPLTLEAPLGRDPRNRKRMAVVEGGRPALTRVRVRERWLAAELLDVALHTGRTHQIRVHLSHAGHPLLGDPVYGVGWGRGMSGPASTWARTLAARVPRLFLHAAELAFEHPVSGEKMRFRSPLPEDLAAVAAWARETSHGGENAGHDGA